MKLQGSGLISALRKVEKDGRVAYYVRVQVMGGEFNCGCPAELADTAAKAVGKICQITAGPRFYKGDANFDVESIKA